MVDHRERRNLGGMRAVPVNDGQSARIEGSAEGGRGAKARRTTIDGLRPNRPTDYWSLLYYGCCLRVVAI